jgi:3-oxosteroid 1-dehydrogenase
VRTFLRGPLTRPASPTSNTGDGLKMAMKVGPQLGNMREAWWAPTIDVLAADGSMSTWLVNGERTRPHSIMVNGPALVAGWVAGHEVALREPAGVTS